VRSDFRDLVAYRLSCEVADEVHSFVARWSSFDRWTVGVQLVRALDSVGANIAEASGRWHAPDRRRLLLIARGSLYESEHWLHRAGTRGLPVPEANDRLGEAARALSGLIRRANPT
jgi:four helix bundle protein